MKGIAVVLLGAVLLAGAGLSPALAGLDNLNWSVQYLIDNSQTVLGVNQFEQPRDNRGLAVSPDYRYLYAGYNNPEGNYAVRKIDLTQPDYTDATLVNLGGVSRGKAISVDDVGRVYLADGDKIKIYDADLGTMQHEITVTKGEGVAVARSGDELALYSSDRTTGAVTRRILTESGGAIVGSTVDTSYGTNGDVTLSTNLRGLEVDSQGRAWVTDIDGFVYVVAADGSSYSTIAVNSPIDVAFCGDVALVTRYTDCLISRFSMTTLASAGADLAAPLAALDLTATPATGGVGGLSGIAVVPGLGFYVSGEAINTAGEKSVYGRVDDHSGWYEGRYYTDLQWDDNDPILFAQIPEPASMICLLSGLVGLVGLRKRR